MHYLTPFELLHVLNSIPNLNLESLFNACFSGVHKRGIHTYRHIHITISLGEMKRIAFRLKSKHIAMIKPLMDFNTVLMRGTRFILTHTFILDIYALKLLRLIFIVNWHVFHSYVQYFRFLSIR